MELTIRGLGQSVAVHKSPLHLSFGKRFELSAAVERLERFERFDLPICERSD